MPIPPARTVTVSPPANAESFYFTYINEKGSDVSAAWLLDLRTRLLKEPGGNKASTQIRSSIAEALDAVARQLLENEYERHVSAWEQASQNIAVATVALDSAISARPATATVLPHSAAAAYLRGGHRALPVPPQRGVVS